MGGESVKEYAIYKGDEILSVGNVKEIAEELGVKVKTVRAYGMPSYKKRTSSQARRLVKLED